MWKRITLAVCCGLNAACAPDPFVPRFDERLAVHALLLAGDTQAHVLVSLIGARSGETTAVPVPDADVRIVSERGPIRLARQPGHTCLAPERRPRNTDLERGCYVASVPGGLQAGSWYELIVDVGARGRASGRVVLPAPPTITAPAANAHLPWTQDFESPQSILTVRWTGVPSARSIQLSVRPAIPCDVYLRGDAQDRIGPTLFVTSTDSVAFALTGIACESIGGMPAELQVIAFDSAYSHYADALLGSRNGLLLSAPAGMQGAAGVLAGGARAVVPILLVNRTN
jgi:hypothetical protein